MPKIRRATHSGSWYSNDASSLREQMDRWLDAAKPDGQPAEGFHAHAIIAPHAGFSYCGHVMAHAFKCIKDPSRVKRVFLLGPSHHHYSQRCLLSPAKAYATPLGFLKIDEEIYSQLSATNHFHTMELSVDEAEHSLELLTPYIAHHIAASPSSKREHDVTLVPILVGALSFENEARYGQILAPYLRDPSNLFVISSDFCHWGARFGFTFLHNAREPIYKSIEWLDKKGMDIIESGDPEGFKKYLMEYRNTICGRHPIGVLLQALKASASHGGGTRSGSGRYSINFVSYDQSQKCTVVEDSSVSYAAAVISLEEKE